MIDEGKPRRFLTPSFVSRFAAPVVLLALVAVWQLYVTALDTPSYLLPSPVDIWQEGVENVGSLLRHGRVTLTEVLAGFTLSVLIGIPIAIGIVYSRVLSNILYPIMVGSQAMPKIAIAPLLLIWLGFGPAPKIAIAFLIAFFPIVVSTAAGLTNVNQDLLYLARSMGASEWDQFRKIRFPQALPSILSGFKVATSLAVVGAVVGEFVGANSGLGYYILVAQGNFNTSLVFASIFALTLIGIGLFYLVGFAERRVLVWHGSFDAELGEADSWTP